MQAGGKYKAAAKPLHESAHRQSLARATALAVVVASLVLAILLMLRTKDGASPSGSDAEAGEKQSIRAASRTNNCFDVTSDPELYRCAGDEGGETLFPGSSSSQASSAGQDGGTFSTELQLTNATVPLALLPSELRGEARTKALHHWAAAQRAGSWDHLSLGELSARAPAAGICMSSDGEDDSDTSV